MIAPVAMSGVVLGDGTVPCPTSCPTIEKARFNWLEKLTAPQLKSNIIVGFACEYIAVIVA
jgi:hypothetical protein